MSSSAADPHSLVSRPKDGDDSAKEDLWKQALNTLSNEDRKQYDHAIYDPLEVLKKVCRSLLGFLASKAPV